jgi:tetratricopeptide (TPR) repeat protein
MAKRGDAAEAANGQEAVIAEAAEPSAAAVAVALGARAGSKLPPEAAEFLTKQGRMLDLQMEHLHEQREVTLSDLRLRRLNERLKAVLQALTIAVGVAIALTLAAMAWDAYEDHGVAIEAFSVPPDLAQRGLTGQVAANQLLDRLAELQSKTVTSRPASTYANDWGSDIKVEIPETGISISQLNRYLRQWLGSETRISGEILRTPTGVAVTARAGSAPGRRFDGAEADIDRLMQQAAEAIYAQTQPYRYAAYLASTGRPDQALAWYQRLALSGSPEDRHWAYAAWAALLLGRNDDDIGTASRARDALALKQTDQAGAVTLLFLADKFLSHWEATLADARLAARIRGAEADGAPSDIWANASLGDFRWTVEHPKSADFAIAEGQAGLVRNPLWIVEAFVRSHDLTTAQQILDAAPPQDRTPLGAEGFAAAQGVSEYADFHSDRWPAVERALSERMRGPLANGDFAKRYLISGLANAVSAQGRHSEAQALIAPTPLDCDLCVDVRAVIAARAGDWSGAMKWMELLERRTPHLPFAAAEHGRLLLDHGQTDAAIVEFEKAHRLGPHFADPLEFWGEALMRKSDYAGAIPKFAEADRVAPRWGRNHLRWGEALMRSGRYREARVQFEAASGMDLSRPDRAALNVLLARTASGPLRG